MFFAIGKLFLLSIIGISRSSIQIDYSSILCWVMLHHRKIQYVVICFVSVYYALESSEFVCCMDASTDMSLTLQHKIALLEEKIKYYQEQAAAADRDFKTVLGAKTYYEDKGAIAEWQREYDIAESALKDTNTNLNSEVRMKNLLKAKLESGDYDMSSKSTATKRKYTD